MICLRGGSSNIMNSRILDIKNLKVCYKTFWGIERVIDGIGFYINENEKVGLAGESGCGKTTTMKSILRVLPTKGFIQEGEIFFKDSGDILKMNYNQLQQIRGKAISMISQEPGSALNPFFTIGEQMLDIIKYSGKFNNLTKKEMIESAVDKIKSVMIPDSKRIINSYPYQLSGGMQQRICIAMALLIPGYLVIADEPGTSLDVTIQNQIHKLLNELTKNKGISLIMVTHSLAVIRELVDRVYIMSAGNIVEVAQTAELFKNPLHPYTRGLMDCIPSLLGGGVSEGIYGYIPEYINPKPGCRFSLRCHDAMDICGKLKPLTIEITKGHYVACHKYCKG